MDFKERIKASYGKYSNGANHITHGLGGTSKNGSVLARYSDENEEDSTDSELQNFDDGGIPLYDLQSQKKLEFKKYLRLQREGLVNMREIFLKM
jgi:hypothetical protein